MCIVSFVYNLKLMKMSINSDEHQNIEKEKIIGIARKISMNTWYINKYSREYYW